MFELYQDAISLLRKYGKPDLLITFTCNPQWEEITSALLIDQKASDRPPCGVAKNSAPCLRDGRCSKRFPKSFLAVTTNAEVSYPVYRRRDNGRVVNVGGGQLDNRWVVSYNPYLLLKFNAHINVEICSTVSAVKYHYKYVYKGHDRAIIEFKAGGENVDTAEAKSVNEISQYLEVGMCLLLRLVIVFLCMSSMPICHTCYG